MKKSIFKTNTFAGSMLFISLLFLQMAALPGCKKIMVENKPTDQSEGNLKARFYGHDDNDNPALDQLVVWKKPAATMKQFRDWIQSVKDSSGPVQILDGCKCGDSSLLLLTGDGIKTYVQSGTVSGGQKPPKGQESPISGEDGPVYYSLNFKARNRDKNPASSIDSLFKGVVRTGSPVKVAFLDTGLDTTGIKNQLYRAVSTTPCIPNADSGWNFVANTANYFDNDSSKHGTTVTRFATDQVIKYTNPIEILPVKTHDAHGVGDLYNILCAFAYSANRQVKIINASFGFYLPRLDRLYPVRYPKDPNVQLLQEFVLHYLTKNHILLVAAAGNQDDVNELASFDLNHVPPAKYPTDLRSLDQVSFYPASLSRDSRFWNVFAVTTAGKVPPFFNERVSPLQNYSNNVVDIGVNADKVLGKQFVFNNPRLKGGKTAEGSSFAAPIFTALLCGEYTKIKTVLANKSKADIWNKLGSAVVSTDINLADEIKDGRVMNRQ